jgi:putative hydrolase of the HAD superfamily
VSSESARCYKPDPRIFHEALSELGVAPEEALYVGDSQDDDIVGAKRAGMQVAWINRTGQTLKPGVPQRDYEIHGLGELLDIV